MDSNTNNLPASRGTACVALWRLVSWFFVWNYYDGVFWMRIGTRGPGLWCASYLKHPPLFSERNGYHKVVRVGAWRIKLLRSS